MLFEQSKQAILSMVELFCFDYLGNVKILLSSNFTILYVLNSSFDCVKSNSIFITKTSGETDYTYTPAIVITPANGDAGINASATATFSVWEERTMVREIQQGGHDYSVRIIPSAVPRKWAPEVRHK